MTKQGLNELKELATEIDELREQATKKLTELLNLFQYDEVMEAREAHESITKASASMQEVAWRLGLATEEIQSAYRQEKATVDFYEELLKKQDNE